MARWEMARNHPHVMSTKFCILLTPLLHSCHLFVPLSECRRGICPLRSTKLLWQVRVGEIIDGHLPPLCADIIYAWSLNVPRSHISISAHRRPPLQSFSRISKKLFSVGEEESGCNIYPRRALTSQSSFVLRRVQIPCPHSDSRTRGEHRGTRLGNTFVLSSLFNH